MIINPDSLQAPRWNGEVADKLYRFPIHVQYEDRIHQTTWHHQPGLELHLTHEGSAAFISDGQTLLQKPRHLLIHNGAKPHRFLAMAAPSFRRSVLCLLPDQERGGVQGGFPELRVLLDELLPNEQRHYVLDAVSYARLSESLSAMEQESKTRHEGWQQMMLAHLLKILVEIRRMAQSGACSAEQDQLSSFVHQAMAYVHDHLADDLSLRAMSALFAVSEEQIIRLFQKELGISFHQYVIAKRIDASLALLAHAQELNMLEIAMRTGFASASHFSRTFRQLIGQTPTSYRKRCLGEGGNDHLL